MSKLYLVQILTSRGAHSRWETQRGTRTRSVAVAVLDSYLARGYTARMIERP